MLIHLHAPSGYPHPLERAERGIAVLRELGYRVEGEDAIHRQHQRFAGTDEQRLADLHSIGDNNGPGIALMVRGGYGLSRLLHRIDFARIARQVADSGTLMVGHSDFTAFQLAYLAQTGGVSFAGPMLSADFGADPVDAFMAAHFRAVTTTPSVTETIFEIQPHGPAVEGTLWGGNLAMLCSLIGTPWMPRVDHGILFIEDVNEHPYRIERMLIQLWQAGLLAGQRAILLGDFSSYRTTDYDNGYDFDAMVAWLRAQLPIPVFTGLPFGHCARKLTLPVGGQATITPHRQGYSLTLSGYPVLPA
jgi:muramoyltetrapeptide carboxypeptidase